MIRIGTLAAGTWPESRALSLLLLLPLAGGLLSRVEAVMEMQLGAQLPSVFQLPVPLIGSYYFGRCCLLSPCLSLI